MCRPRSRLATVSGSDRDVLNYTWPLHIIISMRRKNEPYIEISPVLYFGIQHNAALQFARCYGQRFCVLLTCALNILFFNKIVVLLLFQWFYNYSFATHESTRINIFKRKCFRINAVHWPKLCREVYPRTLHIKCHDICRWPCDVCYLLPVMKWMKT